MSATRVPLFAGYKSAAAVSRAILAAPIPAAPAAAVTVRSPRLHLGGNLPAHPLLDRHHFSGSMHEVNMLHSISPQYWQERAIQARSLANRTTEPEARVAILAVAEQYEHLAQ